jgi:HlyD family secretion protein
LDTPDLSRLKIDRTASASSSGMARPGRRRWLIRFGIAAVLIAAIAIAVVIRFTTNPTVETFTAVTAYPSQNHTLLNATGYVVAQRKAAVASKATGRLEWLGVLEGSHVKKDEIVARLESGDVTAALNQAAANVKVAQANLEQGMAELRDAELAYQRSQDLLKQNFISASANDAAFARYNKAKAAISGFRAAIAAAQASQQTAQVALDQTKIRAPFDGVVLTKNANVGDNITPFSSAIDSKGAVVTIADMDTLEVEADVSESNLAKIRVDQSCEIQLDAFPELRLAGVVSRMVPTMDRSKATLLVKVRFIDRDPRVLPDMSAKVAFLSRAVPPDEKQSVTAVQPAAVAERDGKKVLFVVAGNKVQQKEVTVGRQIGELLEVQGIKPGDKVVLHPGDKLKDGGTIRLAKK